MMSVAVLVSLFFLYSLISRRLEQTIVTAPIVFTVAGMLMFPALPAILRFGVNAGVLSWLAEIGLVLLLFTDASRTDTTVFAVHRKSGCAVVERWNAADHPVRCSRRAAR